MSERTTASGAIFGGIEAGGTKFVVGVGTGPDRLEAIQIPTTSPDETLRQAISFLRERGGAALQAVGIGSFGPVDLRPRSPTFGCITSTPKPGWANCDITSQVGQALGVPVGFDTDVNAAALAEGRWGGARGLSDFLYLTVGTGIGGGAVVRGRLLHGLVHTEMGHIPIRHERALDPYPGCCPFHQNCLEGLASGPSMEARWGMPARDLPPGHPGWELEAEYLSLGLATWICTLSPERIVLGGGVMQQEHVFALLRGKTARILNGYIRAEEISGGLDRYIVSAQLSGRAGLLGALLLAEQAYT